jgi:hypothetical protein
MDGTKETATPTTSHKGKNMDTQGIMSTDTIAIPWSNKPADKDGYYLYVRFNTTQWRAVIVNQGFILNNQDPDQFYAFDVPVMDFEPGFWCGPFVNPHTLYTSQTLTWERPQQ